MSTTASTTAVKILLKNTWFLSSDGFKQGYVFIEGSRISETGEGETPPEYELAELVYDFERESLVVHGYSVLVDIVEYVFRGIPGIDLSVFTIDELKKLANVGIVNSYVNGVTLPVAITSYPEVIARVARENMMRIVLITQRGTVSKSPYVLLLEVDNNRVYYEDKAIGYYEDFTCTPSKINEKCKIIDTRGYGNLLTAIEEVFRSIGPEKAITLLTNPYRLVGIDSGYVEKNSTSDLVIHDTRNPLKTMPLWSSENLYRLLARSQQPDIVFINGDVFYEHGENLAIPVVKIHEVIKKLNKPK